MADAVNTDGSKSNCMNDYGTLQNNQWQVGIRVHLSNVQNKVSKKLTHHILETQATQFVYFIPQVCLNTRIVCMSVCIACKYSSAKNILYSSHYMCNQNMR